MQITTNTLNNITYIQPIGNLLSETDLQEATKVVSALVDEGHNLLVFDLSQVDYFNSNGLNWLISSLTKSRRFDGDTALMNIPEQLEKLLIMTKLHHIFHTVENTHAAEQHFNKA